MPNIHTETPTRNAQYLVLDFERFFQGESGVRYQVYLLPAGAYFEGFGGSRSGLQVGQTPSLIVREIGSFGQRDTEYNLAAKGVWQFLIAEGLTNFGILYSNGARQGSDGTYEANG